MCAEKKQSPIELNQDDADNIPLPAISFANYRQLNHKLEMINNGHARKIVIYAKIRPLNLFRDPSLQN